MKIESLVIPSRSIIAPFMIACTLFAASAYAKEAKLLPVLDKNFCPNFQVALSSGYTDLKHVDASGATVGIELSFDCPFFTLPWDNLRQQLMLEHFDNDGLKMTQFEFNPYYIMTLPNNIEWGFGPGWGVIWSDASGKSDTVFTVQAGTGIKYNLNRQVFIGADARYQWTQSAQLSTTLSETLDNYRANVKIGYRF